MTGTGSAALETADDLLARTARGDERAFESLYRATSSAVLGVCLRLLGDRAEAEDVLQDVYVAVWKRAEKFDASRASATTWLATIARNRAIDRLRAAPARAGAAIDLLAEVPDEAPSPAAGAESASERERLDDCVAQLDARRRRLIRAAFFDGATYEELATRSGSPLGSVKSWIRRGLQQLKACLDR